MIAQTKYHYYKIINGSGKIVRLARGKSEHHVFYLVKKAGEHYDDSYTLIEIELEKFINYMFSWDNIPCFGRNDEQPIKSEG